MPRKYIRHKPLPTKEWTERQLDAYYNKHKVKDIILNTPIDYTRSDMMSQNELESIYKMYNINYYSSKDDFVKDFKENSNITDDMIDKMWNDYRYREALIRRGQYEEIRTRIFRDNYIKALKAIGMSDEQLKVIDKLPLSKWKEVASVPNPDKTSWSSTKLPHLGGFAYSTRGDEVRKVGIEDIWNEVLSTFEINEDMTDEQMEEAREQTRRFIRERDLQFKEVKKRYTTVVRFIPKDRREQLNENSIDDYEESIRSLITPTTKSDRKRVKKSKKGYLYIPFVGSQKPESKNKDIVSDIINEFLGRGMSYSDFVEGWDDMSGK